MGIATLFVLYVLGASYAGNVPRGKQNFPMLRGINRSGTEYACIKGDGFFDGPSDDDSIKLMLGWNINVVRVPLNEGCWFVRFVKTTKYAGKNYKCAIRHWVRRLRQHGLYVIVELHWSEGLYQGTDQAMDWDAKEKCYEEGAKCQKPMPDMDVAPKFWREVADMFKDDESVIFDLFNEPFPNSVITDRKQAWKCWRYGSPECPGIEYDVAGMQTLITAVRSTGAKNMIMLGGLAFANDLEGWRENLPYDPEDNLAASMHSYNFNSCVDKSCWERGIGKIIETHPVIVGEIGQNDCMHKYIDDMIDYLESKQISYLAWTWNDWGCRKGPCLIENYGGKATEYGRGFRKKLEKYVGASPTANTVGQKQNIPMLRGVNYLGPEYSCVHGTGVFDGPSDDSIIENMKKWKINAVRVPLNEGCWFTRFVPSTKYAGENYKQGINNWVRRLRNHGLYVIVDLHWSEGLYQGPNQAKDETGNLCYEEGAKCAKPMPNLDVTPYFWREVADMFKDDGGIIFDLFNEPFPNSLITDKIQAWKCWKNGRQECPEFEYDVAGMQDLVDAVRETGARNMIMLGGLNFANDLEGWKNHLPFDPEMNLAASMHSIDTSFCSNKDCWDRGLGEVVKTHPVIVGEVGEYDCKHEYIDRFLPYLEEKGISYLGRTWNNWNCATLVTNYEGEPTEFGKGFQKYLT